MHPGMMYWWRHRRRHAEWSAAVGCGPAGQREVWTHYEAGSGHHGDYTGGAFGVRRPLRFLGYKLDLDDAQIAELARILDELKTERAQAEVDDRRTVSALADAVASERFDSAKAGEGAALRVKSAERLRDAVVTALSRIHALLDPAQREKLAYLIRAGALVI